MFISKGDYKRVALFDNLTSGVVKTGLHPLKLCNFRSNRNWVAPTKILGKSEVSATEFAAFEPMNIKDKCKWTCKILKLRKSEINQTRFVPSELRNFKEVVTELRFSGKLSQWDRTTLTLRK